LTGLNVIWYDLLIFRYGSTATNFLHNKVPLLNGEMTLWWHDILKVGGMEDGSWFNYNVSNILGNGHEVDF
jgi:hypothetical protein